jgi:4-hydroxy-4-methyl-2-oxoglutarate aldolase
VSASIAGELATFDTGTLCESGARAFAPGLRPVWPSGRLVGRALTVQCPAGQNLMLHRAVARAEPGEVIVVRCDDTLHGYWGEVLAAASQARGITGLVIDGSVRDVEAIAELGFPVFAAGVALPGTGKAAEGSIGEPLEIRGACVQPGDTIVADVSGIVVIASDQLAAITARARARNEMERGIIADLARGRTTLELLGLPAE